MALCSSYTLAALVAELREWAVAGEPQESLMGWLASLVKGLGIEMRTDKCNAPQFLDLPPKKSGPAGSCGDRTRDAEPRRIILSRGRRGGGSRLCAECNGAVIDVRTWTHLAVPPRAFDPRLSKNEVDRAFAAPDADGVILTGHYNVIQIIDGTVVTIHSWTHPKKILAWCLASANGFDVSHLRWGGDETYAEVLFALLAKSPTFLAATGLRLRRGLLCVDDVRHEFQTLERGRCYTIGFRHPNFHPMVADPPGVWNIQLTWRLGSPRQLAFEASRVKQLTIVKISFVWSVVKTLDVVIYGW